MRKGFMKVLVLTVLFTFSIGVIAYAFTAGYGSFAELSASEDPADYAIKANDIGSDTTILAIHGGGIERGTSELVESLDGYGKYNTYLFKGLKTVDNGSLFLKAIHFDEPTAVNLVQKSDWTVSVIGAAGDDKVTYIGGQNKLLAELIRLHLVTKGYNVQTLSIPDRIAGTMNSNIANKNKLFHDSIQFGGVQIAVSKGLRDDLATYPCALGDYSNTINKALSESWPKIVKVLNKVNKSDTDKVLEKGAKDPQELIEDVEEEAKE